MNHLTDLREGWIGRDWAGVKNDKLHLCSRLLNMIVCYLVFKDNFAHMDTSLLAANVWKSSTVKSFELKGNFIPL